MRAVDYRRIMRAALRGAVLTFLRKADAGDGKPIYITFETHYPGVSLPDAVKKKYPTDITVVLEHQFDDLAVRADGFSVTLKFGKVPHHVVVPVNAIVRYFDPTEKFGVDFRDPHLDDSEPEPELNAALPPPIEPPKTDGTVVSLDAFRKK